MLFARNIDFVVSSWTNDNDSDDNNGKVLILIDQKIHMLVEHQINNKKLKITLTTRFDCKPTDDMTEHVSTFCKLLWKLVYVQDISSWKL